MDIIPALYLKSLTKDATFDNYFLIVDASSKILKLYEMENITTKGVMDKLDTFKAIFGKEDEFGY